MEHETIEISSVSSEISTLLKDAYPQKQVDSDHYSFSSYVSSERWASFWHQVDEVLRFEPSSVLEIGMGSGITSMLLTHLGIWVATVDIDPELRPGCIASVLQLPFPDSYFDVVMCFQVLEHLPYDNLIPALREIRRVAREHVVLSLPDARFFFRLHLSLPRLGTKRIGFTVPRPKERVHHFNGEHYWEVGKRRYSASSIVEAMREAGLELARDYRVWEHPYHHVYTLRTRK